MGSNGQADLTDGDIAARIRSEMLRRLYTYSFPVHIISIPAAFLIASVFSGLATPAQVWAWAITLASIEAGRLSAALLFFRARGHAHRPRFWHGLFLLGLGLAMPVWGAAGVLFFAWQEPAYQMILALMMAGIAGVALPLLAPAFWMYAYALACLLAPISLMLLRAEGALSNIAVLLILLALVVFMMAGWRIHRDQREAVSARHAHASVAESLRQEVEERRRVEAELRRRESTNQRRKQFLMELARDPVVVEGDVRRASVEVARKIARGLAVPRVSVWEINEESGDMECRLVLDGDRVQLEPGLAFPPRFDREMKATLRRSRTLAISDTRSDVHARHYWPDYFQPLGVLSILATPYRRQRRIRGFLVAESRVHRLWTEEDDVFMSSVVDFLSLCLAAADQRRAQHRLQEMATVDALTRLPNRNAFHEYMRATLASAGEQGTRVGLLFVDLDRFKAINDSMGHHAGDLVLQEMANRLLDSTREGDWVARLAGDEFTVIVRHLEDLETLRLMANRIRRDLTRPVLAHDTEVTLTCSIGISLFPDHADDVEGLLQSADAAMYEAKREGRNRYAFFTPKLKERAVRRLSLESELRRAVEEGSFILHYQPIVSANQGRMLGVEALVRWQRQGGHMVSPGEFIPLAEETGLVVPLGEWVLDQALRQQAEWIAMDTTVLTMSVNFSMVQCRQAGLAAQVERALGRHQIEPEHFVAEITESDVLSGQQEYRSVFERLREQGIRVAMDDFGTGSSSLGQLKRLPVDILKLDSSFVRDIAESKQDEAITRTAISMADALGLAVIAEGIESPAQRDLLMEAGCDLMQGYYFSRPCPAEDIARLLRDEVLLPESEED